MLKPLCLFTWCSEFRTPCIGWRDRDEQHRGTGAPIGVVAVQACGAAVRFVVARAIDRKTLRAISSLILARGSGCQPSGVRLGVFPFWWSAIFA